MFQFDKQPKKSLLIKLFVIYRRVFEYLSNFILLSFTYFIGIGSIWFVSKITKRKYLDVNFREKKTYWIKSKLGSEPKKKYYRQF